MHVISSNQYYQLEGEMQSQLYDKRIYHDWFELSDDDVAAFKSYNVIDYDIDSSLGIWRRRNEF